MSMGRGSSMMLEPPTRTAREGSPVVDGIRPVKVDRGPGCLFVTLNPYHVEPEELAALADEVWSALEHHDDYRVVLDLREVDLLTSALIGQLLSLRRRVALHGGMLRLCGVSSLNRSVIETLKLRGYLPSYDTRRQAVMPG